nr:EOG090X0LJK [Ceriodaphnia reticulata]
MMSDLPKSSDNITTLTYADDIIVYVTVKDAISAENSLQPYLNRLSRWGRRWGLYFSATKSKIISFSKSHLRPPDPLLFLSGHRIPSEDKVKFLGLIFDRKLTWLDYIKDVIRSCLLQRNLFSVIAKQKYGPNIQTLVLLLKTLVRSKIDYGLIAYSSASKSNVDKIDVVVHGFLRMLLNAFNYTPKATRPKPVYLWTTSDVQKWFRRHCSDFYTVYSDLMIQHGICGRALLRMNDISLERLGIHNADHREEIWRQITKLRLKADILELKDMERRSDLNN